MTGQIDEARRGLDSDPHVMRAKFDEIIKGKVNQIHTYKQAVAKLIAQQEKKLAKIKNLTEEVQKLENLKAGALAMAKQTVAKLQAEGQTKEEIHANEEYQKCLTAYNDFTHSPRSRITSRTSRATLPSTTRASPTTRSTCSSCSATSRNSRARRPMPWPT